MVPSIHTESLKDIESEAVRCTHCPLCLERGNVLFGEGNPNARLLVIGSMPSMEEDQSGRFFKGPGGELLLKIISAMKLAPDQIYITNIIKCRSKDGRSPTLHEIQRCRPFWERQIRVVKPEVICTFGELSTHTLLPDEDTIAKVRGRFYNQFDCKVLPTLEPDHLLRHPEDKRQVWEDLKKIMAYLGISP